MKTPQTLKSLLGAEIWFVLWVFLWMFFWGVKGLL